MHRISFKIQEDTRIIYASATAIKEEKRKSHSRSQGTQRKGQGAD